MLFSKLVLLLLTIKNISLKFVEFLTSGQRWVIMLTN